MTMQEHNEEVRFQIGEVTLAGTLGIPEHALGMVLFAHGSGSSRHSPRNRFVAATLRKAGLGTLLFDLLTKDEETEDLVTGRMRFDIPFLAGRLLGATIGLRKSQPRKDFGSDTSDRARAEQRRSSHRSSDSKKSGQLSAEAAAPTWLRWCSLVWPRRRC